MLQKSRLISWCSAMTVTAIISLTLGFVAGCETNETQRVDTSGPPPKGYETWDDYFEAQDELIKDQEQQMQRELHRDMKPGNLNR